MLVSQCHKARVIVRTTENGSFYSCADCNRACDARFSLTLGEDDHGTEHCAETEKSD